MAALGGANTIDTHGRKNASALALLSRHARRRPTSGSAGTSHSEWRANMMQIVYDSGEWPFVAVSLPLYLAWLLPVFAP